jgi:PAS domain S-box-containing protein
MDEDDLLRQMRDANERLVVASLRAERLAEEAERARATAADSEERFRSLVIASSAVAWRAGADGVIAFEPEAWLMFTGVAVGEGDWLDAVHADDRARVKERWQVAVATSTLYVCEHRLRRRAGGDAWVVARAVPIIRDGVAREWIGMMTDITERIELERAREQFMAILGHDLRSPLTAISLSAEVLQHLHLEDPFGGLVNDIRATSQRMGALVYDLMDFARGRFGRGIPVARRPCDLGKICDAIIAETRRAHPNRQIRITASGDFRGDWDPARLGQLLSNLVENAFAHGEGLIDVSLRDEDDRVSIVVANHGATIPPEVLPTLFEPFGRSGTARQGLGLGLYIVSEIARAHDGSVAVASADDLTTFTVTMRRTAPVAAAG